MNYTEKEIVNLVASGKLKEAIEELREVKNLSAEIEIQLNLLYSRINRFQIEKKLGITSFLESQIESTRIANAILSIIDNVSKTNEQKQKGLNIFVSYSKRDFEYKIELDKYLHRFINTSFIRTWSDEEILIGKKWAEEIDSQITNADIVILLLSNNYLESNFCYSYEFKKIVNRHLKGELYIYPILLNDCDLRGIPINGLEFSPNISAPIDSFYNKEEAYTIIQTQFKDLLERGYNDNKLKREKIVAIENELSNKALTFSDTEKLQVLIKYYNDVSDFDKKQAYSELFEKLRFSNNVQNPITINKLQIEGVSIFDSIQWELKPNINILLGKNGYGKSHLLRLIPCLLRNEKKIMDEAFKLFTSSKLEATVEQNNNNINVLYNNCMFINDIGIVPILAIPAVRVLNPSSNIEPYSDDFVGELSEIGSNHFVYQKPFDSMIQDKIFVFGTELLESKNQNYQNSTSNFLLDSINKLTNNNFKIHNVSKFIGRSSILIEVDTEGNSDPVPIQKASQGTISVLSILLLIHYYMKSLYPQMEKEDLYKQKAIVIIDEIDAHLHPTWQRLIVGLLRSNFPNVQFILSAHSPLIVSGCLEGEVNIMCKKNEDSRFSIHQIADNFIGKSINDIYKTVFDIENADEDNTYNYYLTQFARTSEKELSDKINQLEEKNELNDIEEKKLSEYYRTLQVAEIKERKDNLDKDEQIEDLKAEIRTLKRELEIKSMRMAKNENLKNILDENKEIGKLKAEIRMLKRELQEIKKLKKDSDKDKIIEDLKAKIRTFENDK